jgi:hypothetical protein
VKQTSTNNTDSKPSASNQQRQ